MEEGACLRQADSSFCARLEKKINNGVSKRNEYLDNVKPLAFVAWLNHEGFIFRVVLFLPCSCMFWLVNSSCSDPSFWSPALEEEGHHGHWPKNSGHYSLPSSPESHSLVKEVILEQSHGITSGKAGCRYRSYSFLCLVWEKRRIEHSFFVGLFSLGQEGQ